MRRHVLALLSCLVAVVVIGQFGWPQEASAAQITSRVWTIDNDTTAPNTSVTNTFTFSLPTATTVKGVSIEFCTTASNPCVAPTGFSGSWGATATTTGLGSQTSWTHIYPSGNIVLFYNNSNTGSPSATSTVTIGTSVLSSAANTTVYARMTTYANTFFTLPLDTGSFAQSTATVLTQTAQVPESLLFCIGTSGITNTSCTGATGSLVALGTLSTTSAATGTSQMGVTTNGFYGYNVTVSGTTLTSGSYTVPALATPTSSAPGTGQFGIQLDDDASSPGSAVPTANYDVAANGNKYLFVDGDQVVSSGVSDKFVLFTTTYLANISTTTPAGDYSTTLTYICTAKF